MELVRERDDLYVFDELLGHWVYRGTPYRRLLARWPGTPEAAEADWELTKLPAWGHECDGFVECQLDPVGRMMAFVQRRPSSPHVREALREAASSLDYSLHLWRGGDRIGSSNFGTPPADLQNQVEQSLERFEAGLGQVGSDLRAPVYLAVAAWWEAVGNQARADALRSAARSGEAAGSHVPSAVQPPPTTCPDGMSAIPGGTYRLVERHDTATVLPFCLDTTEVTAAAFAACVEARRCTSPGAGKGSTLGRAEMRSYPVNFVDWSQAGTFCESKGKRLPTEEEWEWAARGAQASTAFPWGNDEPHDQLCWPRAIKRSPFPGAPLCPVGSFPAGRSPQGVMDLAGNVFEWTVSSDGELRVYRGGSATFLAANVMSAAYRGKGQPTDRRVDLGFRCAKKP